MNENVFIEEQHEEELHLRELLEKYLRHWRWFVLGAVVCLAGAFIYLRYATNVYKTQASIIIKDDKNGGGASELSALQDLGVLGSFNSNSVENEIEILRSKRLLEKVVKELGINVSYFVAGEVKQNEVYTASPFVVKVLNYVPFAGMPEESLEFQLTGEDQVRIQHLGKSQVYKLGETITLPFAEIMVLPNTRTDVQQMTSNTPVEVYFHRVEGVAGGLKSAIQVNLSNKNATVINLALEHPLKSKAQDILNELVHQYNKDAINDNNLISKNTAEFIDERLEIISGELDSVETDKVTFKTANKLTDITSEAQLFLENANEFSKRQLDLATQLELTKTMIEYLGQNDNSKLLPTNLGTESEGLATLVGTYNTLVIERSHMLKNSTEKNPVVRNLDSQIDGLRETVLKSLETQRTALEIAFKDLSRREVVMDRQIAKVPTKEKEFRGIERQQNIKEALYLFLLQKREEASISMAVTAPKAKIVDFASSSNLPVAPKKNIVLGGAFLLGLLIPFLFIYVGEVLNNKILSRKDIERRLPELPIVGELPRIGDKEEKLIALDDRSVMAEAFRIMRTNLQYMFVDRKEEGAKTILVTSTTKGEGKSLTAANLAISLAGTDRKVLLVGADLRNPQLAAYLEHNKHRAGLSNYLYDDKVNVDSIIHNSGVHNNLDLVSSGAIPPNPAELLMSKGVEAFFNEVKARYDYLVIDTAPLLLVTDTLLINKYADVTLYLTRSGYTEERFTEFIADAVKRKKLNNVAIVLNDVSMANFGYGNKYGYNYGGEKETFFTKVRKKLSAYKTRC
ncbi:GumC family protein [Robertkochia sediminum]|uniref:GumC family protein n=1 Tax=Robertkochia sediminum TaxID=2785326 RepID=UPI00193351A4|nr:polysaccharide biosynthesis tyrosine autokinase [Robertkochia sediminum]MBL7473753.1 polysaccharide biosynthesis tyrosine autokinase [Robertkochia sediminum]